MNNRVIRWVAALLLVGFLMPEVHAQLGKITYDLEKDKPAKFKDKPLRSESTGEKKFTLPRRFIQNSVTHYNYFFNASNKIQQVIERARMANQDDYSRLIPYYSYSLDNTSAQENELDSVIYKATAGILLHDLRSDWVDNLYLLIGKAYYLRKEFDSASMTFQFINYNLFPRKKNQEDDQLVVGTNSNASGQTLSISSPESRSIIDKAFSRPPSRNDALVWQVRTLTDMEQYEEAAGLINTLKNDPLFPERLDAYFAEVQGYWFFKQQMYDSAITYIRSALPASIDLADKARREYLLAQLYEMKDHQDTASEYYDKAIKHTTDPLMDIYANLNKAKMLKSRDPEEISKSISRLLRMARKDKFEPYRDIVYYSAATLAMEKPDTTTALALFKRSTRYNNENEALQNKAFLELATILYQQKDYKQSYNFYDSIRTDDSTLENLDDIITRKNALAHVVRNLLIIEREDSLQTIAALSPDDRESYLKKLSRKLRKEQGLKETDYSGASASDMFNSNRQAGDIFSGNTSKGEWYFYNSSVKGKGYNDFKRIWGKRQNVDNWRRVSGGSNSPSVSPGNNPDENRNMTGDPLDPQTEVATATIPVAAASQDISVEGLRANLPLTPIQIDTSNSKIAHSLFQLGKDYQSLLEDYQAAISSYDSSLKRFPDSLYGGELYMNLYYCYWKTGNIRMADYYKNLVMQQFSKSQFAQYVLHPERFNPSTKDTAAARRYDEIYNLFIEGNFDQAVRQKNQADSMYGKSSWDPQLLYIQSVYYIHQRQDSAAIKVLQEIVNQYPSSPMKDKAIMMISVLGRRDSIERYLTDLKVERSREDSQVVVFDDSKKVNQVTAPATSITQPLLGDKTIQSTTDLVNPGAIRAPIVANTVFSFDPNASQNVMMVLTKVDPVYSSEARNAFNRYNVRNFYSSQIIVTKDTLDTERTLLIFSTFVNASEANKYRDKVTHDAPSEISWLPAQKYSFYIISDSNLQLLKENKNLQSYIDLLNKKYPGKF